MQMMQVLSLGQEDPLEKEMATNSSMFAWEIPWTEEPGGLQSIGSQKSQTGLSEKTIKRGIMCCSLSNISEDPSHPNGITVQGFYAMLCQTPPEKLWDIQHGAKHHAYSPTNAHFMACTVPNECQTIEEAFLLPTIPQAVR